MQPRTTEAAEAKNMFSQAISPLPSIGQSNRHWKGKFRWNYVGPNLDHNKMRPANGIKSTSKWREYLSGSFPLPDCFCSSWMSCLRASQLWSPAYLYVDSSRDMERTCAFLSCATVVLFPTVLGIPGATARPLHLDMCAPSRVLYRRWCMLWGGRKWRTVKCAGGYRNFDGNKKTIHYSHPYDHQQRWFSPGLPSPTLETTDEAGERRPKNWSRQRSSYCALE